MTTRGATQGDKSSPLYEYSGYLKTLNPPPDPSDRGIVDQMTFTVDDIAYWTTRDIDTDKEWQDIPVQRVRTENAVRLVGRFDEVRRIDSLALDDPSFWVPLGTLGWNDGRFPVDVERFPIAEVTYRCTSENARPAWLWRYPGGIHLDGLPPTRRWRTIARRIRHFGFPSRIDALIFRLYSTSRSSESFEIQSVRFRSTTHSEYEAICRDEQQLFAEKRPPHYPILDEFMPLAVYMSGETARRLAEDLGISLEEYWNLAMEDIVAHRHNCVILEDVEWLTSTEWRELLAMAEFHGVKLVPVHNGRRYETPDQLRAFVNEQIKPYASSKSILAWSFLDEPPESEFRNLLSARDLFHEADPNHPMVVITRHPSAYPLFAPFFAASGIDHYTSHSPWDLGDMVRVHAPLSGGQQFWMIAPAFVYATGTPEWSSCAEMRLMVNLAFANGARGWGVFAYHNDPIWMNGSCQRSLTGPFLTFSDLWAELGERMERYTGLAPLLLRATPARLPEQWYASSSSGEGNKLPPDVPPVSGFRLRGPDYNLYFVVSNDVRGMASVNVNIPREVVQGLEIYDFFDFIQTREWVPMNLTRHLEMFPGQARGVLVGEPDVCARERDRVALCLADDVRRQIGINLRLARMYPIDLGAVEALLDQASAGEPLEVLHTLDKAHDTLVDLIYSTPEISVARSRIIEASAGICGCDGALCRLLARGMAEEATEFGLKVVPLAREVTVMRLALRQGRGAEIAGDCESLTNRVLRLLAEIRALA